MSGNRTTTRRTAAAALLLLATGAFAQGTTPSAPSTAPATGASGATGSGGTLDRADRRFIETTAQDGLAEVALGRLAQQRASDAQVKSFGERMVQDHGKANDELSKIAAGKGVAVPTAPSRGQQRDADRLGKLSGAEFDRAFMKHMVDDHKKAVAAFQRASTSAKDGELKAFAARTLPTLQQHLQMAQSTHDGLRGSTGGSGTMGSGGATAPGMPASR